MKSGTTFWELYSLSLVAVAVQAVSHKRRQVGGVSGSANECVVLAFRWGMIPFPTSSVDHNSFSCGDGERGEHRARLDDLLRLAWRRAQQHKEHRPHRGWYRGRADPRGHPMMRGTLVCGPDYPDTPESPIPATGALG